MTFFAAQRLWLLLAVAAVAAGYLWVQRRGRPQAAVRFTNLELLASVAPRRPGWQRHIAAGLLLASLVGMVIALARPTREVRVPKASTVVLAIDVSVSMQATDVAPSRFEAATKAAKVFAASLPSTARLGLVAFAGTARVVVDPTGDHGSVVSAIDALELAESTAIGDAVLASVQAIGDDTPATVVLLSDGTTTVGTPDDVAARIAKEARVAVTTIAFGTDDGEVTYNGETISVPVGRDQLARLAEQTGGRSFEALTARELDEVYAAIRLAVGFTSERREITTGVVGFALVFGLAAAAASLRWTNRLP